MADTRIEIVVSGDNAAAVVDQIARTLPSDAIVIDQADRAAVLSERIEAALAASSALSDRFSAWWQSASDAGGGGPLTALLLAILVLLAAYAVEYVLSKLVRGYFVRCNVSGDAAWSPIKAASGWGLLQALRLAAFYVITLFLVHTIFDAVSTVAVLVPVLLAGVLRVRIVMTIVEFLAASRDPGRRPTGLTDDEAAKVFRRALAVAVALGVLNVGREFVNAAIVAADSGTAFLIAIRGIEVVLVFGLFLSIRHPIARIVRLAFAPASAQGSTAWFLLGRWYLLYGFLLVITFLTEASGLLYADAGGANASATYSFQLFILVPFILAGLKVWHANRLAAIPEERRGLWSGAIAFLEGTVIVVAAILLLLAWNVDPFASDTTGAARILPGIVSAAITAVVGFSAWRTASAFIDAYAPVRQADTEVFDGEVGRAGSRLETVFPIIRLTVAVVIGTLTTMIALAALGVQIAPLLAGAGILGLGVGFGAQTLVKDVISGFFYLYEDAFRLGEFIETAEGKGAVEKILLRSVRLRHPRGAVHTIPFGSIGTVKNHSRDWVVMKFTLEVAQTEDLERVRKLVKKVGAKLAEDPELEGQFIEPLKCQGAIGMVGPNYQIGVKFTTRPGNQFMIRRKAFAAIQKAIAENGIQIASPRVIVDSPSDAVAAAAAEASQNATSNREPYGQHRSAI